MERDMRGDLVLNLVINGLPSILYKTYFDKQGDVA